MKHFVVAIDGPAGSGKSTVAQLVARRLGFLYVDTGAMYRALTLKALEEGIPLEDSEAIAAMAESSRLTLARAPDGSSAVILDGRDVGDRIRTEEVSRNTGFIASNPGVRACLWRVQRALRDRYDLVMEGRDIGSIVFPDAQVKIYLDATPEERTARRFRQLMEKGMAADERRIRADIEARDARDRARTIAPLVRLPDAIYIDSTGMRIEDEVNQIVALCRERMQIPAA